ncbi:MAG TPA: M23 family metallopeptidase [Dissulfurispiraceae bacterium]|nr:M23 family metallopeptidase [Dissulfurispiraceae bacterium]
MKPQSVPGVLQQRPDSAGNLSGQNPAAVAKKVETIFLNEFLKAMFGQTSFAKNKTIGSFLPVIIGHMADSLTEQGLGFGDFLIKNQESIKSRRDSSGSPPVSGLLPDAEDYQPPSQGRISSRFGLRLDPIDGKMRKHSGIDIAVPENTPVQTAADGKVVFSGVANGYGNCVVIDHGNGVTTLYGHNSRNLVNVGDSIKSGTAIALSGSSGRTTGPHIHFEVRMDGVAVDPSEALGVIG